MRLCPKLIHSLCSNKPTRTSVLITILKDKSINLKAIHVFFFLNQCIRKNGVGLSYRMIAMALLQFFTMSWVWPLVTLATLINKNNVYNSYPVSTLKKIQHQDGRWYLQMLFNAPKMSKFSSEIK